MLKTIGILFVSLIAGCSNSTAPREAAAASKTRDFHFEYDATVSGLPAGAKGVRIWLPIPQSDEAQTITNLRVEAAVPFKETRDPVYGNKIAFFDVPGPVPAELPIRVSFDAHREEVSKEAKLARGIAPGRLLQGDRLAPVEGEAAKRAVQATDGKATVDEKARGIYDRVLSDVAYDKTVPGWGRGDIRHVCEIGKGNCSDFHALFISMARSRQIRALFEIGFPLPSDKTEGTIGGYHCWAWYEAEDGLWKPVDASEADKDPKRKGFFFGTLCCNRVAFSKGRDLVLEPPQAGEPLNFFIYPYVEVDGKPLEAPINKSFNFRDAAKKSS